VRPNSRISAGDPLLSGSKPGGLEHPLPGSKAPVAVQARCVIGAVPGTGHARGLRPCGLGGPYYARKEQARAMTALSVAACRVERLDPRPDVVPMVVVGSA
jgi:hypothetical protein